MATDAQVQQWLTENAGASDAEIAEAARAAGVTSTQLARVTGLDENTVQNRVATATLGREPVTVQEQKQAGLLNDTEKTVQGVVNKDVGALADYVKDQRSKGEKLNPDYFTDDLGYSYDDLVIAQGVAMAEEERDALAAEGKDTSEFDKVLDTQPPAVIYGKYIDYKGDDNITHEALRDETLAFEAKGASGDRIGDPGQFNTSGINAVADPLKNYAKYLLENPEEIAKTVALAYLGQVSPTIANIQKAYNIVSDPMSAATSFIGSKVTGDLIGKAGSDLFDDPALQGITSGLVSAGVQKTLGGDPQKAFLQELKGTSVDILPDGLVGEGGLLSGVTLPDINLPDVTLPNINIPDVPLPNIPKPDFDGMLAGVPSVSLPNINVPDVSLPNINVPDVSVPNINVPSVDLPNINVPDVSLSGVDLPSINVPDVDLPSINVPEVSLPSGPGLPSLPDGPDLPDLPDLPDFTLPNLVALPELLGPGEGKSGLQKALPYNLDFLPEEDSLALAILSGRVG